MPYGNVWDRRVVACLVILSLIVVASFILAVPLQAQSSSGSSSSSSDYSSSSNTMSTSPFYSSSSSTSTTKMLGLRQTCLTNSTSGSNILSKLSIALVEPIFTATPYSQYEYGSFYAFYHKYGGVRGNITSDLGWLNTSISSGMEYNSGWGLSSSLYGFLNSQGARNCGLVMGRNVQVLSDINVTDGGLFDGNNGSAKYNLVIVGFSEYVTIQEYKAFERFTSSGGTLIVMDSDAFQVLVGYSSSSNHEWLISGHGWAFNGKSAWHAPDPLVKNSTNWFGSTLCCFHRFAYKGATCNNNSIIGKMLRESFGRVPFTSYSSHEENSAGNMSHTTIIATFENQSGTLVASYTHQYQKGRVICFCVFGTDIISYDHATQYFLVAAAILGAYDAIF